MSFRRRLAKRARKRHRDRFWSDRDREEHVCAGCGCSFPEAGFRWEVHHRDGDWMNGHPTNLVGICHRCHRRAHRTENTASDVSGWEDRFAELDEGASGTVWRGMTVSRKQARHPDCAYGACEREADTTVTHPKFGEHYVCRVHIVAAASGVENIGHDDQLIADGGRDR